MNTPLNPQWTGAIFCGLMAGPLFVMAVWLIWVGMAGKRRKRKQGPELETVDCCYNCKKVGAVYYSQLWCNPFHTYRNPNQRCPEHEREVGQ